MCICSPVRRRDLCLLERPPHMEQREGERAKIGDENVGVMGQEWFTNSFVKFAFLLR